MTEKLPTKKDIKFLLSEDVRMEAGGKFSLLGVFPSDRFSVGGKLPTGVSGVAFAIPSLAFTFVILPRASYGKRPGRIKVFAPDKRTVLGDIELSTVDLKPGRSAVIANAAKPFAGPAYGTYTVELEIGSNKYRFPFTVEKAKEAKRID